MNLNDPKELASLLEAYLLASGKPLSLERIGELFEEAERPEPAQIRDALAILAASCQGRAFELKEVASGYRLQVRERFAPGSVASGRSVRSATRAPCWRPWP